MKLKRGFPSGAASKGQGKISRHSANAGFVFQTEGPDQGVFAI